MASHTAYPSLHTTEHLLTRLLHDRFPSLTNFKTRMKSRKCIVTFSYLGEITTQDCLQLEKQLQAISVTGLAISVAYMEREEALKSLPNMYQVPADAERVRVVRIGEGASLVDERACIGRHVSNTTEIKSPRLPTLRREDNNGWRINLVVG